MFIVVYHVWGRTKQAGLPPVLKLVVYHIEVEQLAEEGVTTTRLF